MPVDVYAALNAMVRAEAEAAMRTAASSPVRKPPPVEGEVETHPADADAETVREHPSHRES